MTIVVASDGDSGAEWVAALGSELPGDEIVSWPVVGDRGAVEFVAVWKFPVEELMTFPKLKAVLMLSAGGDHLRDAGPLPDVPIVRLVDPAMAHDMAIWATYWVLHFHRDVDRYVRQQRDHDWAPHRYQAPDSVTVGVMGLGAMARPFIKMITGLGFHAIGWSRSGRPVAGIEVYEGSRFHEFLAAADQVVNVVPLTPDTVNLVDGAAFAAMKQGATFINMGRGSTVDEGALIDALASGHLRGAAIDVARDEPLATDSPLWDAPNLSVTPHISGLTSPQTAAPIVAESIRTLRRGDAPPHLFDLRAGY